MKISLVARESPKEEDVRGMLLHLEDEYRKAAISEKNYAELKAKYSEMLKRFEKSRKKISKEKNEKDVKLRKEEKKDIEMFLESLDEQYEKGEINKNDYENIKNVNMQRLKEIEGDLGEEEENKGEVEIEIKKGEKEGVFKKLFGRVRKKKREEGKLEVEVSEDLPAPEEHIEENVPEEPEKEEVEMEIKKGFLHGMMNKIKGEKKLEVEVPKSEMDEGIEGGLESKPSEELPKGEKAGEIETAKTEEVEEKAPVEEATKEEQKTEAKIEGEKKEPKEGKHEEIKEEPPEEEAVKQEIQVPEKEKPKKSGFFKSIFKKKIEKPVEQPKEAKEEVPQEPPKEEKKLEPGEIEEVTPEVIERLATQMAEGIGATTKAVETPAEEEEKPMKTGSPESDLAIEIEKLKVMIDGFREAKKTTDDTIQNISENIGEIRSMVMQADANFKTSMANMEKMEDEVSGIKPKEISKRFNEIKETMEKDKLEAEKLQRKADATSDKVNEMYEMLKSIGSIENLINLNNDIQTKLKDINEAIKYIQRIGTKTEKIFIDLSKGLEDLVLLKAKQEDFDESLKNSLNSIDSLNVKLKDYVSKSDLESFRKDVLMLKKQIDEVKKVLPVAELKLPEGIIKLRKDKEDIEMFLNSLETQLIEGKLNKAEYEEMKRINTKKLEDIEKRLEKEWKDIDRVMKPYSEEGLTPEDAQVTRKKRKKRVSKRKSKKEEDRKKKILKGLKELKE